MTTSAQDRATRYRQDLHSHLQDAGEAGLTRAYEFGRQAMLEGLGVLDIANLHHRALRELADAGPEPQAHANFERAAAFFAESLSPFEMSLRGYREANEHLLALNRELTQAKAAVEAANRELEAFSYSVAHDLRAPLRGIDGFSLALMEDYGEKLDGEAREHLRFLRESATQMAQLIDDLLALSRVTRAELRREPLDLSHMARTVLERLSFNDPKRQVETVVAEGLTAVGDPGLMRAVFDNLLGNAWKFTSRRRGARIEVGRTQAADGPAFFVRDNGAGFDMAYAGRLFGVFQRLHAATEFEGTGIGLATVQRVVNRHGGRVWAEAAVDQGATFYFTLPQG